MTYEIYTFGGGELLWKVFNGLSLLLKSENKYFTPLLALTVSIGAIWVGVRLIFNFNMGIFGKDFFLPFFLLLNIFFVPKCTVWIKDQVDSNHHLSKVENIPVGLGMIASVASKISYEITKALDEKLAPVELDKSLHYRKSGPMFANQLVARAKDIRVVDPIARQNLKNFMMQCYAWPYIYTNIAPGRKAALESRDLLNFLGKNPHPGLGVYWQSESGAPKFLNCKACIGKVKELIEVERPKALLDTIGDLFEEKKLGDKIDSAESVSKKLKTYMEGGWKYIAQDSENVHNLVDQQMLINAFREGQDDAREKYHHPRFHPRLISHSATRFAEQQNQSYLVQGLLAGRYLPSIQTTMFAILLVSFFFVIPMAMLPGGMSLLITWIKLIFWVQSWPVFFTILNCIGLIWLEQSTRSQFLAHGAGLNLLTQNGLSDAAFDSFCFVQGLFWSVPILSWAILNKGGYALVSMAERIGGSLGAGSGAAIVDNTQSFDTQSFHNRTIGSYQMAQQQLSPSIAAGNVLDDGRFRRETDVSGNQFFTEKLANLKNNISLTEGLEGQLNQAASHERQVMEGKQIALNEAKNEVLSSSAELTQAMGSGKVMNKSFSESENRSVQETIDKASSFENTTSNQNALSDSSNWNHSAKGGISLNPGSWLGKSLRRIGVNVEAGIHSGGSWSAEDRSLYDHLKRSGVTDRDLINVSKMYSAVENNQASFTDDSTKRLADNYRGSLDKVNSLNDSINASQSKIDRLSKTGQYIQRSGLSFAENITDDVLKYTAYKRFDGDMGIAARWQSTHGAEFRQDAREYKSGFGEKLASYKGALTQEGLSKIYDDYKQNITGKTNIGGASIARVKTEADELNLNEDHQKSVETHADHMQQNVHGQVHNPNLQKRGRALENSQERVRKEKAETEKKYKDEKERLLITRATWRKD